MDQELDHSMEEFDGDLQNTENATYVLRLYVAGNSPRSTASIYSIHQFCEEHLKGHYRLEVIDIYKEPDLLRKEQIIAAPTLIKYLPLPLRKLIGDLTKSEKIMVGLDIIPVGEDNQIS